jgi:hypothetical protein
MPRASFAILMACGFLAAPAESQTSCASAPSSILISPTGGSLSDFYTNFAESGIASNAIQLQPTSASTAAGDLNSTYFPIYYSLNNLASWEAETGYCLELILVGNFPDVRYFSVAVNDEHYSLAQHVLDADMDPATTATNPFTPGHANTQNQPYLIPISWGRSPSSRLATPNAALRPLKGITCSTPPSATFPWIGTRT